MAASGGELSWYFSQVKGSLDDDVAEGNLYKPFQHIGIAQLSKLIQRI